MPFQQTLLPGKFKVLSHFAGREDTFQQEVHSRSSPLTGAPGSAGCPILVGPPSLVAASSQQTAGLPDLGHHTARKSPTVGLTAALEAGADVGSAEDCMPRLVPSLRCQWMQSGLLGWSSQDESIPCRVGHHFRVAAVLITAPSRFEALSQSCKY